MKLSLLKIIGVYITFVLSVSGQEQSDSLLSTIRKMSLQQLMNIQVVSATRYPAEIQKIPQKMILITHQDIVNRGYLSLLDILKSIPGVDIIHTNGLYPELVTLRGIPGPNNQFKIYVDGIPEHNLYENAVLGFALDYDLDNVERVEILYGPSSTLYGTSAIGGIIQIFTRENSNRNQPFSIQQHYYFYDPSFRNKGFRTSIQGGWIQKKKKIQIKISGSFFQSDGVSFAKRSYPVHSGAQEGTFFSDKYSNSWGNPYRFNFLFKRGNLLFKIHHWLYKQGEGTYANGSWVLDHAVSDWQITTPAGNRFLSLPKPQWSFRNTSLFMQYKKNLTPRLRYTSRVIVRKNAILPQSFEAEIIPDSLKNIRPEKNTVSINNIYAAHYRRNSESLIHENQMVFKRNHTMKMVAGIFFEWKDLPKDYEISYLTEDVNYTSWSHQPRLREENFAFFFQNEWIRNRLHLFAGIRADHYFIRLEDSGYGRKYQTVNPRLGMSWKMTEQIYLKSNIGTAFRTPTAWELFSTTISRLPNPDLEPEKSLSGELVLGWHSSGAFSGEWSVYYSRINHLIQHFFPLDSLGLNQNRNAGYLDAGGMEISARWKLDNSLYIDVNATYQHNIYHNIPDVVQPLVFSSEGSRAPFFPKFKLNFNVFKYYQNELTVNLSGHFVGTRPNLIVNPIDHAAPYFQMDLTVKKYFANKTGRFFLKIQNLFDGEAWDPGSRVPDGRRYPVLLPVPGRIAIIGFVYKIKV